MLLRNYYAAIGGVYHLYAITLPEKQVLLRIYSAIITQWVPNVTRKHKVSRRNILIHLILSYGFVHDN